MLQVAFELGLSYLHEDGHWRIREREDEINSWAEREREYEDCHWEMREWDEIQFDRSMGGMKTAIGR